MAGQASVLSPATCKAIDADLARCKQETPGKVGSLPASLSGWLTFIAPYLLQAFEALTAAGIASPTPLQVHLKACELAESSGAT